MLIGKAHQGVAEAHRLARMRDQPPAAMLADPPTESILHLRVVGDGLGLKGSIETPALEPGDPVDEIIDRRVDAAIAEDGAGETLIGAVPRSIAGISVSAIGNCRDSFFKR